MPHGRPVPPGHHMVPKKQGPMMHRGPMGANMQEETAEKMAHPKGKKGRLRGIGKLSR